MKEAMQLCFKKGCEKFGIKMCSRCMKINYCSKECQKEDWIRHKRCCNLKLADIPGFNELWADSCKNIDAGRYNISIPQSKEILKLALDAGIDPEDSQLSRVYHRLGHVYMGSGDYTSAEIYFKKSVETAAPDDTDAERGLIVFYLNTFRCDEAEPLCVQYLERNKARYGENDLHCAQPLRFIGVLRHRQKRYPEAIEYLEKAYSNWSDKFGPVHPDVQRVTNDLVEVLKDSNDLDKAETFAAQNYDNAIRFSPEANHLTISDTAWLYARVLLDKKSNYEKADSLLHEAIRIRENLLGPDATRVAEVLTSLVKLHIITNTCTEDDVERINRACANFLRAWGENHPDAVDALELKRVLSTKLSTSNIPPIPFSTET